MTDFETYAHAKCILSGEHTVIQGGPALVLPLRRFHTTLRYTASPTPLTLVIQAPFNIDRFIQNLPIEHTLSGQVYLESDVPLGSGLGGSATICVCWSRLLLHLGYITKEQLFETARHLEDVFHGQSSGIDVAGVMYDQPIVFQKAHGIKPLKPAWKPLLYLSNTDETASTKDAVQKVLQMRANNHLRGSALDEQMIMATQQMIKALETSDDQSLMNFAKAMDNAGECFDKWGLLTPSMRQVSETLRRQGALAVKPTGSGMGGYMLSLWKTLPPPELLASLLPLEVS